jgi:DNA replication protein DnaC
MKAIGENILRNIQITDELSDACPQCGGTGWELVEGKGVRECECTLRRLAKKRLESSRIPLRYADAEFSTYIANTPSLIRALQTSKQFVEAFPDAEYGLLYLGNCGVGKTHLACAVLKEMIRRGCAGLFYDFGEMLKEIKDSYNSNTGSSELQVLAPVFNTDVLVLDELGACKPTEWVQETMTQIINTRYLNKKTTIFTTNYFDIALGPDETLTGRVGVRLRSRLKEMCKQIAIEGRDYREVIMEQRGARLQARYCFLFRFEILSLGRMAYGNRCIE